MRSIIAAGLAAAFVATPTLATAASFYDPNEDAVVQLPENPNPANAAAAAQDVGLYTVPVRVFDPADGEFETLMVGSSSFATAAAAAADAAAMAARPMKPVFDPTDGDFEMVPAY